MSGVRCTAPVVDNGEFLATGIVVSFARHGRSRPRSFPRKRESTPQTFGNALSANWIPAFAGMTGVS